MTRTQPPEHGVLASHPATAASDVATEVERLRRVTLECALQLVECDWRAAARSAYAAAWSYHRLPRVEQEAFVVSELHNDDGPIAVYDDWSASAFVAWLIYRMQATATLGVNGRKITASDEPQDAERSMIARSAQDAPATPDRTQRGMFEL